MRGSARFALVCWGSRGIEGEECEGMSNWEEGELFLVWFFFFRWIYLGPVCASSVFYVMFQDAFTARWV